MALAILTQARLKEVLSYDSATGIFTWLVNRRGPVKAGDAAGAVFGDSYVQIKIDGGQYRGHRLAWLYVTGNWPENHIDHRDQNKQNNAWANLREATPAENQQNMSKAFANSSSGLIGAATRKNRKFTAAIRSGGKQINLGSFKTAEEAHAAYLKAKRELHPFWNEANCK